jgi:hypothetical protein
MGRLQLALSIFVLAGLAAGSAGAQTQSLPTLPSSTQPQPSPTPQPQQTQPQPSPRPSAKARPHPKREKEPPIKATKVTVRPLKANLKQVACPAKHTYYGTIVTNGPTELKYIWMTSDGKPHPEQNLKVELGGPQTVTQDWIVGEPGKTVHAWMQLKVTSPNTINSERMKFSFHCEK